MNNLLIGGSGFIGSALGAEMVKRGDKVVSVSLSGEGDAEGVESVIVDLNNEPCPQELLDNADTIYVLNIGQLREGFDADREKQIVKNVAASLKNIRANIVFFSSVAVYGHTPEPVTEDSTCNPIGAYGQFKLEAESVFKDAISTDRLTILRLANIYGTPRNRGFIGLALRQLTEPSPLIKLNGDGQHKRDYVFIDDLVRAILTVVAAPRPHGTVNISTGKSYTLVEVVELVSEVSRTKLNYEITHVDTNEPQDSFISNDRLKKVFGFTDFTPLKDGLRKTYERYNESN